MIIDHGHFEIYLHEQPAIPSAVYCCNANSTCWYQIAHQQPKPEGKHFYMLDATGKICAYDTDPERMFPVGFRVVETDFPVPDGATWDGQTFINPT